MSWARKYINMKYKPFGCSEFVDYVLKNEFNCPLNFPTTKKDLKKDSQLIMNYTQYRLKKTLTPKDGDIVLMNGDRLTCHVGVYVNVNNIHMVLHSERKIGTSSLTKISSLVNYGYFFNGFFTWR